MNLNTNKTQREEFNVEPVEPKHIGWLQAIGGRLVVPLEANTETGKINYFFVMDSILAGQVDAVELVHGSELPSRRA